MVNLDSLSVQENWEARRAGILDLSADPTKGNLDRYELTLRGEAVTDVHDQIAIIQNPLIQRVGVVRHNLICGCIFCQYATCP